MIEFGGPGAIRGFFVLDTLALKKSKKGLHIGLERVYADLTISVMGIFGNENAKNGMD